MLRLFCIGLLLLCALPACASERMTERDLTIDVLNDALQHPWSLAFLPDGQMLVSERGGRLLLLAADGDEVGAFRGLPTTLHARGQGGLLDILPAPDFDQDPWLYLAYSAQDAQGNLGTEVARARVDVAQRQLNEFEILLVAEPKLPGGRHFGARLVIDGDWLYIGLGDRGHRQLAQDPDNHLASVIRLHRDGRIPTDNPFVDQPGHRPENFTLGNRNVQGMAQRANGQVWMHEHGPRGGDEINIVSAGANYGWPDVTYGVNYSGTPISDQTEAPGITPPVYYWDPSIAPSGMAFIAPNSPFEAWRGDLLVGSLRFNLLVRLELDGNRVMHEERILENRFGRIRDVRSGLDGLIYVLTDSRRGQLIRLRPASN